MEISHQFKDFKSFLEEYEKIIQEKICKTKEEVEMCKQHRSEAIALDLDFELDIAEQMVVIICNALIYYEDELKRTKYLIERC